MATDASRDSWDATRRTTQLAATRLFAGLPPAVLAAVATRCRPRRFRRGEVVFLEGDSATAVHLLAAGRVKLVQTTADGQTVILRLVRPGEPLDLTGGWGEARHPATAVALDEVVVLTLPASDVEMLVATQPALALAVVHELGARLGEAEARIRELQTERVERRIARNLLRLASAGGGGPGVPLSRQDLADLAGTTLSTASRVLAAWHRQGLVVAGRELVTIRRPDALAEIAEGLTPPDAANRVG